MDWVQQVQVTRDSSCGDNLLYGLPVKDNSVVVVQFYCVCGFLFSFVLLLVFFVFFFLFVWIFFSSLRFFCCVSSSAFFSDDAVNSEEGKLWR